MSQLDERAVMGTAGRANATRKQVRAMARDVLDDSRTHIRINVWGGGVAVWRVLEPSTAEDAMCELVDDGRR